MRGSGNGAPGSIRGSRAESNAVHSAGNGHLTSVAKDRYGGKEEGKFQKLNIHSQGMWAAKEDGGKQSEIFLERLEQWKWTRRD